MKSILKTIGFIIGGVALFFFLVSYIHRDCVSKEVYETEIERLRWEIDMVYDDAYGKGFDAGYDEGYETAECDIDIEEHERCARSEGYDEGYEDGIEKGKLAGYENARDDFYWEGYMDCASDFGIEP